jgi:hypothetical protein
MNHGIWELSILLLSSEKEKPIMDANEFIKMRHAKR